VHATVDGIALIRRGATAGFASRLCHVYEEEKSECLKWFSSKANFSASVERAKLSATFGTCKLEILGMFPPRTEAPTADKLTLCYAPHVDMTTVIEVEVGCAHSRLSYPLCADRSVSLLRRLIARRS